MVSVRNTVKALSVVSKTSHPSVTLQHWLLSVSVLLRAEYSVENCKAVIISVHFQVLFLEDTLRMMRNYTSYALHSLCLCLYLLQRASYIQCNYTPMSRSGVTHPANWEVHGFLHSLLWKFQLQPSTLAWLFSELLWKWMERASICSSHSTKQDRGLGDPSFGHQCGIHVYQTFRVYPMDMPYMSRMGISI